MFPSPAPERECTGPAMHEHSTSTCRERNASAALWSCRVCTSCDAAKGRHAQLSSATTTHCDGMEGSKSVAYHDEGAHPEVRWLHVVWRLPAQCEMRCFATGM